MRFRYLQVSDIPDCIRLYQEYLDSRTASQIDYPQEDDRSLDEFSLGLLRQMAANPHWFAIVAVLGSKVEADPSTGEKRVIGGRVKGLMTTQLSERPIGRPKRVAFIELVIVDKKFAKRGVARKLAQLTFSEAIKRNAEVIEGCWAPGSLGEQIWPAVGLRPYRVLAAYVLADGTARTDMPLVSASKESDMKQTHDEESG